MVPDSCSGSESGLPWSVIQDTVHRLYRAHHTVPSEVGENPKAGLEMSGHRGGNREIGAFADDSAIAVRSRKSKCFELRLALWPSSKRNGGLTDAKTTLLREFEIEVKSDSNWKMGYAWSCTGSRRVSCH